MSPSPEATPEPLLQLSPRRGDNLGTIDATRLNDLPPDERRTSSAWMVVHVSYSRRIVLRSGKRRGSSRSLGRPSGLVHDPEVQVHRLGSAGNSRFQVIREGGRTSDSLARAE
jgi:hypothetical protein